MKISTKGRYGLRVMLELALGFGKGPIMMSAIAERQGISRKYQHILLTSLKEAGLVQSIRGAGGGYILAKEPQHIRVSEIVQALEGPFVPVDCTKEKRLCERANRCATREVWRELGETMERVLSAITLDQLAQRQLAMQEPVMYYI